MCVLGFDWGIIFVSLFFFFTYFQKFLFSVLNGQGKEESEEPERPGAIISNHVSYIDVLYHMHSSFPSFVAKVFVVHFTCYTNVYASTFDLDLSN